MSIVANEQSDAALRRVAMPRWLPLAGVLALAVLLRLVVGPNMDVSWGITLGEKVLGGQRLYVDILEVNPPATVFLYLPGILIERAIGLRAEIAIDALVFFGACVSILLAGRILDAAKLLEDIDHWTLAALTLAVLTVLPTRTFGEREHIAVIALLPFLALAIVRAKQLSTSWPSMLIAGAGSGLAIVIKPHFAIPIGFAIFTAAFCARSWRLIFAVENWIAGALAMAYGTFVVFAYPEFISDIVPLVRTVYLPTRMPLLRLLTSAALFCWLAALCILVRWRAQRLRAPAYAILLAASAGFFIVYVIQGKGWPYHAYPMLALAFIAMAFAASANGANIFGAHTFRQRAVAILPAVVIALTSAVYFNIAGNTNALIEPIRRLGPNPKMLIVTSDLSVGHPLTRQVGGTWVSRVASLWISAGVFHRHVYERLDADTKAVLRAYADRDRDMLAGDIRLQKPDVIVMEHEHFAWDEWARADPVIAEELTAYRVADRIGHFTILARVRN